MCVPQFWRKSPPLCLFAVLRLLLSMWSSTQPHTRIDLARMERIIGTRAAANTLIVLFSLALIFQVVVLLGFIPIEMVWGGRLRGEQERIYGALVSIAVLLIMIAIVLIRRGVIGRSLPIVGRWGIWVVVVVFALNTVGNLLAWDTRETLIFTPITLLATLLAWRVAQGE